LTSCSGQGNSSLKNSSTDNITVKDTIFQYMQNDNNIYLFDTLLNKTQYQMKTYCLNDSAIQLISFSDNGQEIIVAHNYTTDLTIKTTEKEIKIHLFKENFKDSLSSDFINICQMWKNEFSHVENGIPIFRATFAQPDTDYQLAILYLLSINGDLKILKVQDESYNGSDEE
jgi:hypothetical protein